MRDDSTIHSSYLDVRKKCLIKFLITKLSLDFNK